MEGSQRSKRTRHYLLGLLQLCHNTFASCTGACTDAVFIYNGNGCFIILVSGSDYITVEDIINLFKLRLEGREEYPELKIEYKIGIAETFKEHQTARKLFAKAIQNKKEYVCEPRETDI